MANVKTPQDVLSLCRQLDVKAVDFRYTDPFGRLHHTVVPTPRLSEEVFEDGIGLPASRSRDWQSEPQDMRLIPYPDTAHLDPFATLPTLSLTCTIQDPLTGVACERDPRGIAIKAAALLATTGIADSARFGVAPQFYVFADDSNEMGTAQIARNPDSAYDFQSPVTSGESAAIPSHSVFRCQLPLTTRLSDARSVMMQTMQEVGMDVASHHHSDGTQGQCQFDLCSDDLTSMADKTVNCKYIVRNVAHRHGLVATFMPKPIEGAPGSGMHTHFSLWKAGEPLFAGAAYGGMSDLAMHAVGGILKHTPAIMAIANPTINSYKRLLARSAPVKVGYGSQDAATVCRIPAGSGAPRSKRIEFQVPDPSANSYLTFAAIVLAAIDGINHRIEPGQPEDGHGNDDRSSQGERIPRNLESALEALESDHQFLLSGDVFSEAGIRAWIDWKRNHELRLFDQQTTPLEYQMYFDA